MLVGALPTEAFYRFATQLKLTPLAVGDLLYESGQSPTHAYFPTTAIVSLGYVTDSGASLAFAGVGYEGMVGISIFLGGKSTLGAAVVQTAGYSYKLERSVLLDEFERDILVQRLLLRYTQALLAQTSLMAACNRHHTVEQQLCRWLLVTLDRIPSGELKMTQEQVAGMMGVRREGITEAAGRLQKNGIILYRRGHISVLKRPGLEQRVCECYGVVKKEFTRLISGAQHRQ